MNITADERLIRVECRLDQIEKDGAETRDDVKDLKNTMQDVIQLIRTGGNIIKLIIGLASFVVVCITIHGYYLDHYANKEPTKQVRIK